MKLAIPGATGDVGCEVSALVREQPEAGRVDQRVTVVAGHVIGKELVPLKPLVSETRS